MSKTMTAEQQFEASAETISTLLNELAADLEAKTTLFDRSGRRNWGHAGDLNHVTELLQEAHRFLHNANQE